MQKIRDKLSKAFDFATKTDDPFTKANDKSSREFRVPRESGDPPSNQFTGRKDILAQLQTRLVRAADHSTQNLMSICGPGGVGKTQIARQFGKLHSQSFTSLFWIDSTDEPSICRSFAGIAKHVLDHFTSQKRNRESQMLAAHQLGLSAVMEEKNGFYQLSKNDCKVAEELRTWFAAEGNTRWLLIFDGYDEPEQFSIRDHFPRTPWGSILITTRRTDICAYFSGTEVTIMGQEEAYQLLNKTIGIPGIVNEQSK